MYLEDFNEVIVRTNLKAFLHTNDIVLGKLYEKDKISLKESKRIENGNVLDFYHYEVDSQDKKTYYDVLIYIENNKNVTRCMCDCRDFRNKHSCQHIAAVFVNYYDTFFGNTLKNLTTLSDNIIDKFVLKNNTYVKKKLNVELIVNIENKSSYYYYGSYKYLNVKVLIGENKLYTLGNHLNAFRTAYFANDGEVYFGKEFVYNPDKYYVSEEDDTILNTYFDLMDGYSNRYYASSEIKKFLSKLKDTKFVVNNYEVNGIIEGMGVNSNLAKVNDNYELNFDLDNIETFINDDYEYILYKGAIYHLNKQMQDLIDSLFTNNLDKIMISKNKFNDFTKGLLSVVKKNLVIDSTVDDVIIPKDVICELYFDIKWDSILVNPKFIYDGRVVEYFNDDTKVLRDREIEAKVINELLKYGFCLEDNSIVLKDLELQVEFMESGLEKLAEDYAVYTTENYKKVNINKKMNINSMFRIGKDNIFSYNFNTGDINSDELVDIFSNMRDKKKYYRLKNGNIISLEDESLKELSNLKDDLELSDEEIILGKGSILKYRAIYLDSLKKNKYSIINTDNLFDQFINNFYQYKNSELSLAKEELKVLRDYQLTGVKWLYNLAKTGFGGILADEMGLGKTIQIIYFIKQMLKDNPNSMFLIVVPTSLAYNWEHEFLMYGKEIKRVIAVGSKQKRSKILQDIKNYNVVVTTYGLLREDQDIYQQFNFDAMVIDEAQNIKNNMAGITKCVKKIKASTKLALTGTPLENSVLELWSIFDFIMPGYLASFNKFQIKYKIKDFDEDTDILIKGLSHQINPFILRRKKSDVIKELPKKLVNDIYVELDNEQKKLYMAELEKVKKEMTEIIEEEGISKARFMILQLLMRLRQICIDPKIVYDNYEGLSVKMERINVIVNEYIKNGHKILIFSSFRTALNIVKRNLNDLGIATFMIDGSVPSSKRMEMVDKFNDNDDIKVFLIMLKSGGTGLNLASADVVIHLDLWWNPQAENQATDRAHRIGQKNMVEVIHLITKGTIEEKILELQNKKRILSEKLIDGEVRDKNLIGELTEDDIKELLSYENRE